MLTNASAVDVPAIQRRSGAGLEEHGKGGPKVRERVTTVRLDEDRAEAVERIARIDCVGDVYGG